MTTNNAPPEFGDPAGLLKPNPEEAPRLRAVGAPIEPSSGMPSDRLRAFLGAASMVTHGGEMPAVLADIVKLTARLVDDGLLQVQAQQGSLLLLSPAYGAVWVKFVPPAATTGAGVAFYVEPTLGKARGTIQQASIRLQEQEDGRWLWENSTIPGLNGTPPSTHAFAEVLLRLFSLEEA